MKDEGLEISGLNHSKRTMHKRMIFCVVFGAPLEKIRFYLHCLGGAPIPSLQCVILSGVQLSKAESKDPLNSEGRCLIRGDWFY